MKLRTAIGLVTIIVIIVVGLAVSKNSTNAQEEKSKIETNSLVSKAAIDATPRLRLGGNSGLLGVLQKSLLDNSLYDFIFSPIRAAGVAKIKPNQPRPISKLEQDGGVEKELQELDGPDIIRARTEDYLRRHGMGKDFDPNQRLRLVHSQYERMEAEKAGSLLRPEAVPGTNWVSLGPTNGAGRMTAIAVHPTIPGTLYAGAAGGGVWKTTDGGGSWVPLTDSITDLFVGALAIAPSSPNIIYLGTGEGNTFTPGIGLLKSTDGGNTWQFPTSVIAKSFYKISVHPTNSLELVIGTDSGAFRSTNGGQTWMAVMPGVMVFDIVRHPSNPQILYATVSEGKIMKSADGGASWMSKSSGITAQYLWRMSIAINPANPQILYAAGATSIAHIYKTVDGGESWSDLSGVSSVAGFCGQCGYDNTIVVSPSDPNVVIAGGVSYVKTTDGGTTWSNAFSGGGYPHVDAHDLQFQGSTLFVANDGGIWSSNDNAQSATDRNSSLVTRQYYTVANDPINRNRVFGGTQDNGTDRRLGAGGATWTRILGGDGFDCAVNPYAPEVFYSTIQFGEIHRTKNVGTTTYLSENISPNYPSGEPTLFFTPLTMDSNNPSVLYTANKRLWKSVDGGDSWSPLPTTTTDGSSWPTDSLLRIAVARSDSRILMVLSLGSVFRSTNGGASWVAASAGLPIGCENGATNCSGIEIDSHNADVAYVTITYTGSFFDQHIYMTTNGGISWLPRGNGLPPFSAHVVRVDPTDSNVLFCGTDVGVYKSIDKGLSWVKFGTGLPSVSVYDLRILDDGSVLRVATHGRGMWELQIPPSGNNPPLAAITNPLTNLTVTQGTNVNLQGMASDPDPGDSAMGIWYVGDTGEIIFPGGGNSNISHVFNRAGVYPVVFTAKDTHGTLGNATRTITVSETFDSCATPMVISGSGPFPLTRTANKDAGTKQPTDPPTPCLGNDVSHTFWFEFTPSSSAIYQFSTTSSYFNDVVSLWKGPTCGPYTAVPSACTYQDGVPITATLEGGVTVRIMVSSWVDNDTGTVTLSVGKIPAEILVSVTGKVIAPDSRGLRNATVSMTDSNGVVRTATTSSFGFFTFANVTAGGQYLFRVQSRSYRYSPVTVTVSDNLTLPDFVGLE